LYITSSLVGNGARLLKTQFRDLSVVLAEIVVRAEFGLPDFWMSNMAQTRVKQAPIMRDNHHDYPPIWRWQ